MPSLKEFKCIMEESINDTLEKTFTKLHGDRDFIVDEIKTMYQSVVSISQKFSDFYSQTLEKQCANEPVEALAFVAQLRADSYRNVMAVDQLKYSIMSKIYEKLPSELNSKTVELIQNVKVHAEYQALTDRRLKQSVDILTCIKSNNLRAELDLQLSYASAMSLQASYSDSMEERTREQGDANDLRVAANLIIKYMPELNEQALKPLSMEQFIRDQKQASEGIVHKLHIPSLKQVCSFIPTMRTVDAFVRENPDFDKNNVLLLKKALLAINGRDVKSVVSGLVTAKISMFKNIEREGHNEETTKVMKDKASYLYRTVLRDVEAAFKVGYAMVVPAKHTQSATSQLSMA
ncbi:MAG: hypothetical protein RSD49_17225 [Hafnia sp.]